MYAIVKIAGRQYKVEPEQQIKVDRLQMDAGSTLSVNDVLLVSNNDNIEVGNPSLGYNVNFEVMKHDFHKKVTSVIFKRRGGMRRKTGSRKQYTLVKVKSIEKGS